MTPNNSALSLLINGREYKLFVAVKGVTMRYLYRVSRYAYNDSLYNVVRRDQEYGYISEYYIESLGYFQLQALDPQEDLKVIYVKGKAVSPILFSDFLITVLGYKPILLTPEEGFRLYIEQTA